MQTRHEYAADNNLTIITDDNSEFWAADVATEYGIGVRATQDDYIASRHDNNGDRYGEIGNGPTMDAALADLLTR